MRAYLDSLFKRLRVLGDKSALLLTAPFAVALYLIDPAMLKTLLQWLLFGPVLAGVAIIISRLVFPQIELNRHVDAALKGNTASGLIVAAIIVFVGLLVMSLAGWSRA